VTYVLIGVTVLFYLLQMLSVALWGYPIYEIDWLELYGARINSAIRAGNCGGSLRPFSCTVPCRIFSSICMPCLPLAVFWSVSSDMAGSSCLYFLGAFTGNVFSFLFTGENGYSVGASTAVFGLIGAQAVFFYQNRKLFGGQARQAIGNTVFIIAINLFIGLSPGIDNWGHVGGLLGGAMFAWFAGPRWMLAGTPPEMTLSDEREGATSSPARELWRLFLVCSPCGDCSSNKKWS
jgi:rhomboid protease GluP